MLGFFTLAPFRNSPLNTCHLYLRRQRPGLQWSGCNIRIRLWPRLHPTTHRPRGEGWGGARHKTQEDPPPPPGIRGLQATVVPAVHFPEHHQQC